jgi:hypothetical protein
MQAQILSTDAVVTQLNATTQAPQYTDHNQSDTTSTLVEMVSPCGASANYCKVHGEVDEPPRQRLAPVAADGHHAHNSTTTTTQVNRNQEETSTALATAISGINNCIAGHDSSPTH